MREGVSQRPPCRFEIVGVDVDVGVNGQAGDHVDGDHVDGDAGGGGGGGGGESSTTNSVAVAVVLDVSHNPPAIKRFFEKVRVLDREKAVACVVFKSQPVGMLVFCPLSVLC